MKPFLRCIPFVAVFVPIPLVAQDDLRVFTNWMRFSDAPNALYHHIAAQAYELLDQREERVRSFAGRSDWQAYRQQIRATLREVVGRFPERTPLNVHVAGVVEGDGFTVEKIQFESMPGYVVTASVFLPSGLEQPAPAIIYTSGHSAEGFRSATYQNVIINLALKGFVVLAYDPPGQGERMLYGDSAGVSLVGGPTRQHSYPGAQVFAAGYSPALYAIWDGMRAVDYLSSRDDVDSNRIGVTGRSGGGTQSAYLAAFDDRIAAAAPENYLTSFRRLFESRGPQDAEQNFFHGIARGIDHADLIIAQAPKPYLVIATSRDMFAIQGVRETLSEVQRGYDVLGAPDALESVVDDAAHASTRRNREALYGFFRRTLDHPGDTTEVSVQPFEPAELWSTRHGTVLGLENWKDQFSHNADRVRDMGPRAPGAWTADVIDTARRISGYREPDAVAEPVFVGRFARDEYDIEQYFVRGEGDYAIPYLLFLPTSEGPHPAVVYVHSGGKLAQADGHVLQLVRAGFVVLAADMLGTGELGSGDFRGDAFDFTQGIGAYNIWWGANQVGRSLVGMWAGDVTRMTRILQRRTDIDAEQIVLVGQGVLGPAVLHAAAFDDTVRRVMTIQSAVSYFDVPSERRYLPQLVHGIVPGAITAYDLWELAVGLDVVVLVDPVDHLGNTDPSAASRFRVPYAAFVMGDNASTELQPFVPELLLMPRN